MLHLLEFNTHNYGFGLLYFCNFTNEFFFSELYYSVLTACVTLHITFDCLTN